MAFISCGHHNGATVHIISVQQCNVSHCSFHNIENTDSYEHSGSALYIQNSYAILTVNEFQHNTAEVGGALTVESSSLNLTRNIFHSNSAQYGGAVYINTSKSIIIGNTFEYNSGGNGGVLCILHSTLSLTGNTFQNISAAFGGALYVDDSTLNLTGNMFQNNSAYFGGGLYVYESTINLTGNIFQNDFGGALSVYKSTIILTGNIFQNNSDDAGGALFVHDSTLNLTGNTFQNNSADFGGALYADKSTVNLTGNTFHSNSAIDAGAFYIKTSKFTISGNTFEYNNGGDGGVLHAQHSNLSLTGNTFQNSAYTQVLFALRSTLCLTGNTYQNNSGGVLNVYNSALNLTGNTFQSNYAGGALHVQYSTISLTRNTFQNNSDLDGGAIYVEDSTLNLTANTFQNNSADYDGGALYVLDSILNFTWNTFQYNSADNDGGALYVKNGTLSLTENTLQNNSAVNSGGALHIKDSTLSLTGNTFQNNSAVNSGGAQYVFNSILYFMANTFQNSSAAFGGTLYMGTSSVTLADGCFADSYAELGGAIFTIGNSTLHMQNITIGNNTAQYGGGMAAVDSQLKVFENTYFENNRASYGGGLYVHNTEFNGNAIFTKNSVTLGGGGIYASDSIFFLTDNTMILNNSAVDGGGVLLSGDSKFIFQPGIAVHLISNSATNTGGAIKVEESNTLTYCITTESKFDVSNSDCFFQIQYKQYQILYYSTDLSDMINSFHVNHTMYFNNNSAVEAGIDLYGGSVDSCRVSKFTQFYDSSTGISGYLFDAITSSKNKPVISSDPLQICTCRDGLTNCTGSYHPEPLYPGGTLQIPVIALGQRNGTTTAVIQVTDSSDIRLSSLEYSQKIDSSCNTLKYTIHSRATGTTQEMTLYAQGPCSPTQTNTLTVTMNIQHCPPGFELSVDEPVCMCAKRLQQFTNTCIIDSTTVLREHNAEFWVGYDNESRGLILHPNCPFHYCTSKETYLAVDDSDKQCNYNRSGLLCGRCSENLSLALGSSHCLQCSNSYLSLIAAFAFAGVALVLLLLVLRLTVAAGTINGLVFYANIVAVNSAIFFPPQITNVPTGLLANVLSVFIAWINLDLGIKTCFYNGMDAYVKIWLQFAFPLYVWALVGMIIVGSYYSGKVASIFGSNPIAVLATLFLLSYAKLLRTVIAILSYTSLEYPNNSQIAVWLYDGNIRYLSGKHIPLFTAAMFCLIFLFLPYTMLLIFSQWLQAKSHLKIFSRINSRYVKPFLDAYHAPYTNKHRYWTGVMLLLRFVLFLISAVNALGDPSVNLLAIASITAAILILPTIFSTRIYKMWSLGLLEMSFIFNLNILAVATLYIRPSGGNQNAATFTSVGIAFATFTGIVIYHYVQQIKSTRLWRRRVCLQHDSIRVPLTDMDSGPEDVNPPNYVLMPRSAPTCTVVDMRDLREPCMATD